MEFFTIGVYNSTETEFFDKLTSNNIDTFCDIRQRRGVRGSKYSFVNSIRLQEKLGELAIKYAHLQELAPTSEIRELQRAMDEKGGVLKRERQQLGRTFVVEYKERILEEFDFDKYFENLENMGASRIVLFCVEEHPEACHRSIVSSELAARFNFKITHL